MNNSICNECFFRNECKMREPTAEVASCYCYKHDTRITNADRIRAMSDEELSDFLSRSGKYFCHGIGYDPHSERCDYGYECEECWIDWLKQEATDGRTTD